MIAGSPVRSFVEILILGGPVEWNLKLHLSGLANDEESERYSATWQRSLAKLPHRWIEGIGAQPMNSAKAIACQSRLNISARR